MLVSVIQIFHTKIIISNNNSPPELDDVVDFLSEVEDGWWKGKLRGRVGVFPSNFVEMLKTAASNTTEDEVADKNKRNEKLKGQKINDKGMSI